MLLFFENLEKKLAHVIHWCLFVDIIFSLMDFFDGSQGSQSGFNVPKIQCFGPSPVHLSMVKNASKFDAMSRFPNRGHLRPPNFTRWFSYTLKETNTSLTGGFNLKNLVKTIPIVIGCYRLKIEKKNNHIIVGYIYPWNIRLFIDSISLNFHQFTIGV